MTRARDIASGTIFTSADNTKLDGIAAGATVASQPTINVTVAAVGGSNKFHLDGTSQQTALMVSSGVYKFDQSHSSNASHPLRISTTADGTHGGGSAITTDFVAVGTAGQAGAYVTFTIQQDGADTYYYYCANHSGMGGAVAKNHHSGAGNQHVPAAGATGQLLQYASAGTAAWATVSSEAAAVAFPSDWTSPTNTYNSSGTWSKGSLADTAYVWFFLLNSGSGGGNIAANGLNGGAGGSAMLIYAQAKTFNGAAYVIGAAKAGATSGTGTTPQNPTTLTLSSGNGSTAFTPLGSEASNVLDITSGVTGTYLVGSVAPTYTIYVGVAPSGYPNRTLSGVANSVFAGGHGLKVGSGGFSSTSLLSGDGGVTAPRHGIFPGGGGGANGGQGGTGAAGQLRVYHV